MKVVHVGKYYPPRWGGMETALKDICETTRAEVDVRAIVASHTPGTRHEVVNGVPVARLANWCTLFSQPVTPELFSALSRVEADIVHLHEPNPLAMSALLAARYRGRIVVHYHSDIVRQRRLARFYRPLLDRGLARADAIIAGSHELVNHSEVLAGVSRKCRVIPFGIDLRPFLAIDGAQRQTRAEAAPGQTPLVLAVGRLSYYKGFQHLIEAMRTAPARLVIVGEGEMRQQLESLIARHALADRVLLAGKVSERELLDWYARADLFCLPSCERSEAFGLVMVEAMAAGLPVVSTDLPTGVRVVNANEVSGLVVPPGNAEALATALGRLAADPGLRLRMGAAARQRACDLFSRELMGRRIVELYRGVLGASTFSAEGAIA